MIELAKQMLKEHEGLRLKPYRDTVGKLTIGIGRNLDDVGITEDEAYAMLDNDLVRVLGELNTLDFWCDLGDVRQAVLVDMCFNLGWGRFTGFRNMLAACRAGDYETAALEMLDSRWHRQVGRRARRLAEMMKTGEPQ